MASVLSPKLRKIVDLATGADATMCWTCSSCDSECPVEIATNRLRPQKIVRLANLGLIDELITLPEIWYCLTCRRCTNVCPNLVKPEILVRYARAAAVRCGVVPYETARAYYDLFRRFQRARWHAVAGFLHGADISPTPAAWRKWLDTPIPRPAAATAWRSLLRTGPEFKYAAERAGVSACYACGGCSSVCPVACEGGTFDPRFIFRMVNLGLQDELLRSPAIWLCVQCGRCTDVCGQGVDGCGLIASLREIAIGERAVTREFPRRVAEAQKQVYLRWLDEVDMLLGAGARCARGLARPIAAAQCLDPSRGR